MPTKKHIRPGEKVPLKLTAAQRTLILEGLTLLDKELEAAITGTPEGEPVMMTLDDLEDLGGFIAAEANHCEDSKKQRKLDTVLGKIEKILTTFTDAELPQTIKIQNERKVQSAKKKSRRTPKIETDVLFQFIEICAASEPLMG